MSGADRLIEIFNEAKALPAGAERDRFLAEACGDNVELKAQALSLLHAHDAAGEFLGSGPALSPEIEAELARLKPEEEGERIGRYKLLQEIGQGGFGTVWMAEQIEPVTRRVALKIIKMGMDTREVIARFEAERQALAMMDHPNIAKVLDAGATPFGRPFFVMELVKGIPITEFCDESQLGTRERLALFGDVCSAINHAHQKGVIHRDIKPSNVMITLHGDKPVVKVIDFGIAKATQGRLTDKTIFTRFEQFIGTPVYMSPEQATLSGLDIDTRSDIYALGILLYELLTGKPPFDPKTLASAGYEEMRRIIREVEPPKPSSRLSTAAGEERTSLAKARHVEPDKLDRLVEPDLDWIVMKAIEKDRARRYETANGLAQDIQRFLADETVSARPPSARYQIRKFARRHKTALRVAAAITALLLAATTLSTWLAVRANRDRVKAVRAEGLAVQAQAEAKQEAAKATQERENALRAGRETKEALVEMQIQRAEDFFSADDPGRALALLARVLASDPSNHIAAERILSALTYQNSSLPLFAPVQIESPVSYGEFSEDGLRVVIPGEGGTARIWDVVTNQPLSEPLQHEAPVDLARFSPDGLRVVTAGTDNTARIWDIRTGKLVAGPLRHQAKIRSAQFSPDGRWLATASEDKTARIWDVQSGQAVTGSPEHAGMVRSVQFSPDGSRIVTASKDGTARIWDARTGISIGNPLRHADAVWSARFSPDGRSVITASADETVRIWDAISTDPLGEPLRLKYPVSSAQFSPDGLRVITATFREAQVWDLEARRPIGDPLSHDSILETARFSPDGLRVVTASLDKTARIWDPRTGKLLFPPLRHETGVDIAEFDATGMRVRTVDAHTVRVWDAQPGMALVELLRHDGWISTAHFSSDGLRVVTASDDNTARVWDALTGKPVTKPLRHEPRGNFSHVWDARFSPDGLRVVTAAEDNTARVWDALTGEPITDPLRHTEGSYASRVLAACFSPDGLRIVTAARDQTVRIWDAQTGRQLGEPILHQDRVNAAEFSPDGLRLVTASNDLTARVWDAQTGKPLTEPLLHAGVISTMGATDGDVYTAHFSPDGLRVVTASANHTARVWDATTGKPLTEPLRHEAEVVSAEFSPDGLRVVTASRDKTARIWDARSGKPLTEPIQHGDTVAAARFSPDGSRIVTACSDNTARVWDAKSGKALTEPLRHHGPVTSAEFSPDGSRVLTASGDKTAGIWEIPIAPMPAPLWLAELAVTVGGKRLNENSVFESVAPEDFLKWKGQISQGLPADFYSHWGQWFCADRATRTISPFSHITVPEYIEARIEENTLESLDEVTWIAAGNPAFSRRISTARQRLKEIDRPIDLATQAMALANQGKLNEAESLYRQALALNRNLWANEPTKWESNLSHLMDVLRQQGKLDDAERVLNDILTPSFVAQPQSAGVLRVRGDFLARRGRWDDAIVDFSRLIQIDPNDRLAYHALVPLLVQAKQIDAYRQRCQQALLRFHDTSDANTAERMAKDCSILPDSGIELAAVGQWTETAVTVGKQSGYLPYFQFAKALSEYRQGHFTGAVEWAQKPLANPGRDFFRDAESWLVLAMAQQQLQQEQEARASLARAIEVFDTHLPKLESGDIGDSWIDWIITHALMKEAANLIEGR